MWAVYLNSKLFCYSINMNISYYILKYYLENILKENKDYYLNELKKSYNESRSKLEFDKMLALNMECWANYCPELLGLENLNPINSIEEIEILFE